MMEPIVTEPFPGDGESSLRESQSIQPSKLVSSSHNAVPEIASQRADTDAVSLRGLRLPFTSSEEELIIPPARLKTRKRDEGVVSRKPKPIIEHITASLGDQPVVVSLVWTICVLLVAFFVLLFIRSSTASEAMFGWLDYAILGTYCLAALCALLLMLGSLLWSEISDYKEYGAADRERKRIQDKQNSELLLAQRRRYDEFMEGGYEVGGDAELPGVPLWAKDEHELRKYKSKITAGAVRHLADIVNFEAGRSAWTNRYYGPSPNTLTAIPEHSQPAGAAAANGANRMRISPPGSRHGVPHSKVLYPPSPDFRSRPLTYPNVFGAGGFAAPATQRHGAGKELGAGPFNQPRTEINAERGGGKGRARGVGKFTERLDTLTPDECILKVTERADVVELRPTTPGLAV
jgi:hypothetical protein